MRGILKLIAPALSDRLALFRHEKIRDRALKAKREDENAIKEFEKAIALDSTFALANFRLAQARKTIYWDPTEFRKALTFIDRLPEREQYLLRALSVGEDYTEEALREALRILKEAEKVFPDDR